MDPSQPVHPAPSSLPTTSPNRISEIIIALRIKAKERELRQKHTECGSFARVARVWTKEEIEVLVREEYETDQKNLRMRNKENAELSRREEAAVEAAVEEDVLRAVGEWRGKRGV